MKEKSASRLAYLDVARGLAALLVLAEHGLEICLPGFGEWSHANVHLGRIGVLLFLAISGFIIPQSLQEGGSNARFWLRRFFRLFPAYWMIILLGYIYACIDGRGMLVPATETNSWLCNLTMLQGFFEVPHVWGMFWTLQLELVIYAVCSLLLSLRLLKHTRILLWLGAAVYLIFAVISPQTFRFATVLFLYLPYVAAMVGYVAHSFLNGRGSRNRSLALLIVLVLAPLLVHIHNIRYLLPEHAVFHVQDYLYHYLIAYVIFFALAAVRHLPMPWFACRLGQISYSVYLTHALVLRPLSFLGLPPWLVMLGLVAGTVLLSEIMFRLVEAPCISLGRFVERRLFSPRNKTPETAQPVPVQRAA